MVFARSKAQYTPAKRGVNGVNLREGYNCTVQAPGALAASLTDRAIFARAFAREQTLPKGKNGCMLALQ
jgi:hypothetical protein